ncbi:GNAT family N-acetyltransferase [Bacillaceae bacterium W0354]
MIETVRCLVQPIERTDFNDVKELYLNEEVRKFLGGVREKSSVKHVFDEMINSDIQSYYWAVRKRDTSEFIGLISLDPHHDGDNLEVSYQFLPKWWNKGYATEVVRVIIDFAFNTLNLPKIVAETQIANTSSCKLLEKLGMKIEDKVERFGTVQAIYSLEK